MSPNQLYQNTHEHQTNDSPFPILAIAVLSIAGTAFLLVSYYIFIIKCCSSLHQIDHLFRRLSAWRPQTDQDPFIALSPSMWNHGLDQSVIHDIPTAQYKRRAVEGSNTMYGCTVCLNEFQEQDMLRVLPRCSHQFHLDCIDVWLQTNSNCPLCRSSISGNSQYPFDQIIAPSSSPQDSIPYTDSLLGGDEDFVVIELGGVAQHGGGGSRNFVSSSASVQPTICQSDRKLEKSKPRKQNHASIMGDECIDVRKKDDQFYIQPIRRSFSLDSAKSQQLYLTVQTVIQQNRQQREFGTAQESDRRVQRSSHSFRHGQGSRNAIFPI